MSRLHHLSVYFLTAVFLLTGCGYDSSPEQFREGVSNQYDRLIEKVKEDPDLSDHEKEMEIAELEQQRADFSAYAGGEQSQE